MQKNEFNKNSIIFNLFSILALLSWGISISVVSDYKLHDRASIPGRGKGFFPLCPDRLWGPLSLLSNGYRGPFPRGVTLTTHPIYCRGREWVGAIPLPHGAGTLILLALPQTFEGKLGGSCSSLYFLLILLPSTDAICVALVWPCEEIFAWLVAVITPLLCSARSYYFHLQKNAASDGRRLHMCPRARATSEWTELPLPSVNQSPIIISIWA
jgi:hypothetical protein